MTAAKTKLTVAQKRYYVQLPNHCPYCGSTNIEARGDRDVDQSDKAL